MIRPIKLTEADVARFWSKIDRRGPDDCWEWRATRNSQGYGRFRIGDSLYRAHRIALAVTYGDTKLLICHRCNNPACCNPKHLYAGTQKDNIQQCYAEGRNRHGDNRGENHGNAKLVESDICEIRRLRVDGWLLREIAEEYDISFQQVSKVCRKKLWKHV